jgi:hypothetical protein
MISRKNSQAAAAAICKIKRSYSSQVLGGCGLSLSLSLFYSRLEMPVNVDHLWINVDHTRAGLPDERVQNGPE